ncbi:hypothetical protein E3N88_46291 [Mikania micrantha]|uniref:Uncharacterized protein n=1 Tax=Mikania micrantha TaxID=192012 RepID=A0A5N6L6U3_9ASTR|nr:hypothetical protein E3N88_46291 [Mikania micrantha]
MTRNCYVSDQVQNCYRLRREAVNGINGPVPKPKEIWPRLSGPFNSHLGETLEEAAVAAAYKVAEAENKMFVAAEAVKEAERVYKMAEEAETFLHLAKEIYERCNISLPLGGLPQPNLVGLGKGMGVELPTTKTNNGTKQGGETEADVCKETADGRGCGDLNCSWSSW